MIDVVLSLFWCLYVIFEMNCLIHEEYDLGDEGKISRMVVLEAL